MGRFSVDYWVLELLLRNVKEEIILKDDEHHVNIDLGKVHTKGLTSTYARLPNATNQ